MLRIVPKHDIELSAGALTSAPGISGELPDPVACPLCRTEISSASARLAWTCGRCGQRWTPLRLATVAAYVAWVEARSEESRRSEGSDSLVASPEAAGAEEGIPASRGASIASGETADA